MLICLTRFIIHTQGLKGKEGAEKKEKRTITIYLFSVGGEQWGDGKSKTKLQGNEIYWQYSF
jgi:hypothetical protein